MIEKYDIEEIEKRLEKLKVFIYDSMTDFMLVIDEIKIELECLEEELNNEIEK